MLATEDPRTYAQVASEVPLELEHSDSSEDAGNGAPVTKERHVYVSSEKDELKETGVSRASEAAGRVHTNESVLQQHVTFFDRDNDGVIYPHDTFRGCRDIGFNLVLALFSTLVIHVFFSYPTLPAWQWLPDPFFRVYTARIHRDKHGSDTGAYDNMGAFVPGKFEGVFERYSSVPGRAGLTVWDTVGVVVGQRCAWDPVGWGAAVFEWMAVWFLVWPEDGVVRKEDVRGVYDGSLFWRVAERRGVKIKRE